MKTIFTDYIHHSLRRFLLCVSFMISSFAISPIGQAVSPAPDGGYPGFNTAEGQSTLLSLTTGQTNTALGAFSLGNDTTGSSNTATGKGSLRNNTTGAQNTATGVSALFANIVGNANTAVGFQA